MPELRHQDDVSRQAAARVIGKLLEGAKPEDQFEDTREAQCEDRVSNKRLLVNTKGCYLILNEHHASKFYTFTSTVPALSPACL